MSKLLKRTCKCGNEFVTYKTTQSACSRACRPHPRGRTEPTDWSPEWKKVGNQVYACAWRRHPGSRRERVYLHKLIAEGAIGRPYEKNEVTHHVLDSQNNDVLEVITRSEHAKIHGFGDIGRLHPNNPRAPHNINDKEGDVDARTRCSGYTEL